MEESDMFELGQKKIGEIKRGVKKRSRRCALTQKSWPEQSIQGCSLGPLTDSKVRPETYLWNQEQIFEEAHQGTKRQKDWIIKTES